jgi:hypothetical protein
MSARDLLDDVARQLNSDLIPALVRAASIDPDRFCDDLRERGLPIQRLTDLRTLDTALLDPVAESLIESARRRSALSGVGLGMGGWLAIPPEILAQLVQQLKLAQRLSLLYGVDFRSPAGELALWKAMAEGADVTVPIEGSPRQVAGSLPARIGRTPVAVNPVVSRLALAVVRQIVTRRALPVGRLVPVVASGVGMVSNYVQFGRAGRRMMAYYRRTRVTAPDATLLEVEILES